MRRGKARVPTEGELKRLLVVTKAGANARRNVALLAASYRLGLRAKEMASLVVEDVLGDDDKLREECQLSAAMTKGGKPRMAYLTNPSVRSALKDYLDERRSLEGSLFNRKAALFRSTKGGRFTPNTMQQLFHKLHERAGIGGGRSHSGRRWFATELIGKGVDLKSVSVLMGHSSVAMTAQYAEDNPYRLRRIVAELV
jgi:integrase/recombinase XerD